MKRLISIVCVCCLVCSCGDNPFSDNELIKDTDYAQIRLEMGRCSHIASEGSFLVRMRWSPKTDCLNHLKTRIVSSGNALNNKENQ